MEKKIPRIVIAATHSGAGKTTIVTGILAALSSQGLNVQSYKIGPDYIDPGYHTLASGKPGHNLDTWLVPEEYLQDIFSRTMKESDIAVIEGVMGLYDGGDNGISSTAAIAKLLNAPVVLVIDAKSMGDSAAAIALGFKLYDSEVNLAGVILNRLGSVTHKTMICEAMEKINISVIGAIFRNEALKMPERHLGLTPVTENQAEDTVLQMKNVIETQVDIEALLRLAEKVPMIKNNFYHTIEKLQNKPIKIGIARDEAFSFYYPESLAVLELLGAELVFFSPLKDEAIPDVAGLIIGGGFPEMFVDTLAINCKMRQAILTAGKSGMPIYAECGGLMYLTKSICDFSGQIYPMVGLIPATCQMNEKLQTVGYVEAIALTDNVLCLKDEKIHGHEFHFSSMQLETDDENFPWAFEFHKKRTGAIYAAGYQKNCILASYLHVHFAGNITLAKRFLTNCQQFRSNFK